MPQVIINRVDQLPNAVHVTLKVASVMGQYVDLNILHKFHMLPISRADLLEHLHALEARKFLKITDNEGVWEFNMVERDIVYNVSSRAGSGCCRSRCSSCRCTDTNMCSSSAGAAHLAQSHSSISTHGRNTCACWA
jgi:hypothetical protein